MIEVARAVLGLDPHNKYPKKGICVLLGFGERHIGNIFHRYLFQHGAFHIHKNSEGQWESCGSDAPGAEPAPPMIPQKYIQEISWETKSANIFSRVIVKNEATGTEWEIIACNSKGDPNMLQGINVNLYVIDEDIANAGWFTEAVMRTNSVSGFIRWAAYPQASNDAMLHLIEECEDQEGEENPTAVLFKATMWDNTYTSEKAKHEDIKALQVFGEDVVRRRVLGELDLSPRRVYAGFDKWKHSLASHDVKVSQALKELDYVPPSDWCRYATLDPGSNVFAVLFWAVPPPKEFGDFAIIYDELYIHQSDAEKWGELFHAKVKGHDWQDFIIDSHGARLREQAGGELPRVHYQRQLEKRGLKAIASGTSFTDGSDNIAYREVTLREWLTIRTSTDELIDGTPKLLVAMHKCPNLLREMMRFKKKTRNIGGEVIVLDDADRSGTRHDAVDCAEYGAAHGLKYVRPPLRVTNSSWFERVMAGRKARAARRRQQGESSQSRGIVLGARGA